MFLTMAALGKIWVAKLLSTGFICAFFAPLGLLSIRIGEVIRYAGFDLQCTASHQFLPIGLGY